MCMNKLWQNLNFFIVRIFLVSILLIIDISNFFFPSNNEILFIVLFFIIIYDIIGDIIIQIKTRDFIYDEVVIVGISLLLFFTSQFKSAILVILFYQILNRLLLSFLKHVSSTFVSDFLIEEDNYLVDGKKKCCSDKIVVNQNVYINKGQVVPVDGIIKSGTSIFKSPFSRNNQKVKMTVDGDLLAGMINTDKRICMRATSTYQKSLINRFLTYLSTENNKSFGLERTVNKIIKNFKMILILMIILYIGICNFYLGDFALSSLNLVLVLLMATTFISLKAFLPFIHYVTLYKLSVSGIVIKDFDRLSKYCSSRLVILNKTGVGTIGEFKISEVVGDSDLLFRYLNYAEFFRDDRIARAIKDYKNFEVDQKKISNYEFFEGEGISLKYDRDTILVGNYYLFKQNGLLVDVDSIDKIGTVIYVSVNKKVMGYVVLSDMIKTSTIEEVLELRKYGFNVLVMSGDNSSITSAVTREIQASECYSSLLSDERAFFTDYVREKYHSKTLYISDRGDDYFLNYNDFGITLNERNLDNIKSEIAFIDDDLSRVINLSEISRKYKNSIILFFSFFLFIRLLLLILAMASFINIEILMFGEFILTIIMLLLVLRVINDRKRG